MGDPVTHRRRAFALLTASAALLAGAVTAAPAATAAPTAAAPKKCYTQSTIGLTCHHHYGAKWAEYGSTGAHVKEIQALINETTIWPKQTGKRLAVDGDFGPSTESAVSWFQWYYGSEALSDGMVGPKTWEMLRYGKR